MEQYQLLVWYCRTRSAIGRCNYFLFEKMDVSETAAVEGNDPLSSINVANVDPPGPKIVAGRSLDRFNMFLSQLYSWLCAQPGIVIGRSSNILVKEVCPPRERRKRAQPSGNGSVEVSNQISNIYHRSTGMNTNSCQLSNATTSIFSIVSGVQSKLSNY